MRIAIVNKPSACARTAARAAPPGIKTASAFGGRDDDVALLHQMSTLNLEPTSSGSNWTIKAAAEVQEAI